ncbi:cytochrome c [Algiphilus sp.]|uniref:c-type cytochrome n=1 Tax=Algiphilus sp. TaxID=1872431 RepID=UPI001CA74208|nr:cytochrome c [Algiphilus sp.]MBY8964658.1 cytochrome c [Algiphilus acroporae]MCI5063503.1 cytochrome c [Algiphilus sp.]MCI5103239.1 cytochrome c [Algiphilus sp.]MCR9091549.1 cytochrome c [Pseudomonadota bacterium]
MRKTLALLTLCAATTAVAEEERRPLEQLVGTCAACHGQRGDEALQPSYPILAGQHQSYLEQALRQYRSGERNNAIMNGQAANLSDADIRALAAYYARQESALYTPAYPNQARRADD